MAAAAAPTASAKSQRADRIHVQLRQNPVLGERSASAETVSDVAISLLSQSPDLTDLSNAAAEIAF
jgi:hypothetical protein